MPTLGNNFSFNINVQAEVSYPPQRMKQAQIRQGLHTWFWLPDFVEDPKDLGVMVFDFTNAKITWHTAI